MSFPVRLAGSSAHQCRFYSSKVVLCTRLLASFAGRAGLHVEASTRVLSTDSKSASSTTQTVEPKAVETVISIDRSGLLGLSRGFAAPDASFTQGVLRARVGAAIVDGAASVAPAAEGASAPPPLLPLIRGLIAARGAMSVADYMRMSLSHPTHGYYMSRAPFGSAGDFTTSPEMSKLFGDALGVWVVAVLRGAISTARGWSFVEIGPGTGTLAADVLRVVARFPDAARGLRGLHLVETSARLRGEQAKVLGVDVHDTAESAEGAPTRGTCGSAAAVPGVAVTWHQSLRTVPAGEAAGAPIMLAHELFDALPIYQFLRRPGGWRELLVDTDEASAGGLRQVIAKGPTPASVALSSWLATPAGAAYARATRPPVGVFAVGDVAETCPEGVALAADLAARAVADKGVALVIDYGRSGNDRLSLRGIENHRFVDPLAAPGRADLSADVDFAALAAAAHTVQGASVAGPTPQGEFLQRLGIKERLARAAEKADEKTRERLVTEARRLAHPDEMGAVYKALCIAPEDVVAAVPGF